MRSARDPIDQTAGAGLRFVEAESADFLEQLSTSRLVQAGAVNLICLEPVKRRMGPHWAQRQAEVWGHVDAAIGRIRADRAYFRRVSETDFVIAISGVDGEAAQAMCLTVLSDTLTRFLGVCDPGAAVISTVTGIEGQAIACRPVDPATLPDPDEVIVVARSEPKDGGPSEPPCVFASATGLSLSVAHVLEPLVNLTNGKPAGLCAEPVVSDVPTGRRLPGFVLSRLPDADLARIDSLGLAFAQRTPSVTSKAHSLLVPLSMQTLASTRLREAALAELKARRLNSAWVVILSHIEHGAPPSRLADAAALLRPYCGAVFASVPATMTSFGHLSECRFQGLVIDLERWAGEPDRVAHYLQAFGDKAAGLASVLAVRGLASDEAFATARAAGLTHASVRAMTQAHSRAA